MTVITPKTLIDEAFVLAEMATQKHINNNPGVWYPCGFAWVRIRPARGAVVKYLKDNNIGHTDDYAGGLVVYNPSGNPTQWMDAKEAGARAFAAHLQLHGIKANAESRID